MFRCLQRLVPSASLSAVCAASLLSTGEAHADVAPPGVKAVQYSFTVKGLAGAPDRVLFAYPCSISNGRPMAEHKKLEEGAPVSVGRRGGSCTIYSVDKGAYETWLKDFKPEPGISNDPAVDKLVSESVKCTGAPTPVTSLPERDPRTSIHQTITVSTLNKTECVLTVEPVQGATAATPASTSSASPSSSASASSKSRGCSFTATSLVGADGRASSGVFVLALAGLAGIVAARRRR